MCRRCRLRAASAFGLCTPCRLAYGPGWQPTPSPAAVDRRLAAWLRAQPPLCGPVNWARIGAAQPWLAELATVEVPA